MRNLSVCIGLLIAFTMQASDFPICTQGGDQIVYGVSFGNSQYLVVWEDRAVGVDYDIKGQRISVAGDLLEGEIEISLSPGTQFTPDVAFDGTRWLVVYYDNRTYPTDETCLIYGVFVGADGSTEPEFIIADTTERGIYFLWPHIAWNGDNYLVTFYSRNDALPPLYAYDCLAQIVRSDGTNQGGIIEVAVTDSSEERINVAGAEGSWLAVWSSGNIWEHDIYGRVVYGDGSMGTVLQICTAAGGQDHADLSWNGTYYLVVWQDWRGDHIDIYGVRVDEHGNMVPPEIHISTMSGNDLRPGVTSDGENWLCVWWNVGDSKIYGQRVDSGGNLLGESFRISSGELTEINPYIACDGERGLVVWSQLLGAPTWEYDIYGNLDHVLVGIEEAENYELRIKNYELRVYPNPFMKETFIRIGVKESRDQGTRGNFSNPRTLESSNPSIKIYDLAGRLIRTLPITDYRLPITEVTWDGRDSQGERVQSGAYFVRLRLGRFVAQKKIIFVNYEG